MGAICALAKKDLRLLMRDRMDLFFTFVFPLFIGILFGSIFAGGGGGGGSKMKIAVVDEDRTPAAAAFVHRLEQADEFAVESRSASGAPLTRPEADDLVRRGDLIASVVLPKGFGDSQDGLFRGQPIRIEGTIDPSRSAESAMLNGMLMKYAFQQMTDMFSDNTKMRQMARRSFEDVKNAAGMDPRLKAALEAFLPSVEKFAVEADGEAGGGGAPGGGGGEGWAKQASSALSGWEPVKIEFKKLAAAEDPAKSGPTNAYALTFSQAVIWGILGCTASFAISLSTERQQGTLMRLMLSPLGRGRILAGKALACFLTCLAVAAAVLVLGRVAFGVVPRSAPMLAVVVLCIGIGFVGVMMLVATLGRSAGGSSGLGRAVLLVLAMVGGGSIPLFFMPPWMQTASSISPFKWAIQALDGAIWRPLTPAEVAVPCAVLLGFGVVGFAVGSKLFAWGGDK